MKLFLVIRSEENEVNTTVPVNFLMFPLLPEINHEIVRDGVEYVVDAVLWDLDAKQIMIYIEPVNV